MTTEFDLRQRDFFVTRPLGTGHSNPHDVLRTRKALNMTGHAQSPPNPSKIFDPSLIRSLDRFQHDWGLKEDSVIEPGGPTEATLELAVQAMRDAGPDGMEMLRGPVKVMNQRGFRFRQNPDDPLGSVLWRTREGEDVSLDQVQHLLSRTDSSDETEIARQGIRLAMMPRSRPGEPHWRPGEIMQGFPLGGGGGGRSRHRPPAPVSPIFERQFGVPKDDDEKRPRPKTPAPATPSSDGPAKRTVPIENPPKGTPPFPADPPPDPETGTAEPKEEVRPPTLTVFPVGEEKGPAIEIFPDMSDALEAWLVVESRGKPDGQQKDTQFVIDYLYKELGRREIERKHVGGGYSPEDKEYVKERFIHKDKGKVQGGRRPDGTFEVEIDGEKRLLDFNLMDTLVDLLTGTKRERDALKAIMDLKEQWSERKPEEQGETIGLPKSKGWNWDQWTAEMERRIDEYLDSKWGPFPK